MMKIYNVEVKQNGAWTPGISFHRVDNAMSLYWNNIAIGVESRIVDNSGQVIMELDGPENFIADNDNKELRQ